jgi:ribosomal protein L25 (general stress protein Ctc)
MNHSGLTFVGGSRHLRSQTDEFPKIIVGDSVSGNFPGEKLRFTRSLETEGLASAIALKNVGHNVVVLEKDVQLGGGGSVSANLTPSNYHLPCTARYRMDPDVLGACMSPQCDDLSHSPGHQDSSQRL